MNRSFFLILAGALPVTALGVIAAMAGEADDAPGLSLIGIVLIVGALAGAIRVAQRTAQRTG
jgi:hypothetical protein